MNIHPFPLNANNIGTIRNGVIYALRITEKRSKEEMRIYFRSCGDIIFSEEVVLMGLTFIPGIYFYDMLSSRKVFEIPCEKILIDIENIKTHKISFKKLKRLIKKQTNKS